MTNRIISAILGLAVALGAVAADNKNLLSVSKVDIFRHADDVTVALDINTAGIKPGRNREVILTPVIVSADGADSLVLDPIRVAGRNRYYAHLRNGLPQLGQTVHRAGSKEQVSYRRDLKWQPWMERSTVTVRQDVANCCDEPVLAAVTPIASLDYAAPVFRPPYAFVSLTGDSAVVLTAEGSAFIEFPLNRTHLDPNRANNPRELANILSSIRKVKDDPDASITSITIKGYASPEGIYSHNVKLAMGRTATLKDYVREHLNFDPAIMHTDYEPEDWDGLIRWLESSDLPHKDEIIAIAKSDLEIDRRDVEIRRTYPEEYAHLLENVYPALRHSDYTVKYRVRTYATIEELKRAYATAPERLRPVDFQRIADSYTFGSPEYDAVMLKAVQIYPDDCDANINAANLSMEDGDLSAAARYASKAGDTPAAVYTRGVLASMQGDLTRAAECLRIAAGMGMAEAQKQLNALETLVSTPKVKVLVPLATPDK